MGGEVVKTIVCQRRGNGLSFDSGTLGRLHRSEIHLFHKCLLSYWYTPGRVPSQELEKKSHELVKVPTLRVYVLVFCCPIIRLTKEESLGCIGFWQRAGLRLQYWLNTARGLRTITPATRPRSPLPRKPFVRPPSVFLSETWAAAACSLLQR